MNPSTPEARPEPPQEITIPEHHVEFCREVARLCAKYELDQLSARFRPGWRDDWRDPIELNWSQGRHGAESDHVHIASTKRLTAKLEPPR